MSEPLTHEQKSGPDAVGRPSNRSALIALCWLIAFCAVFFSLKLPNSGYQRREILSRLPLLLLDIVDPPQSLDAPPSGWEYLPQRLPLAGVAVWILCGCWGIGRLILRLLRVRLEDCRATNATLAFALGLSAASLMTLGLGLAGQFDRTLLGGLLIACVATEVSLSVFERRFSPAGLDGSVRRNHHSQPILIPWLIIIPFLIIMITGALSPPTDFDVRAYHLQGPKEYFQAGQIKFLPHNVYTSFPFLSEMLSLLAMVLADDWFYGALAGKLVLMCFAPLTALGLFAAGRRWFGIRAAWFAVVIHLATPWVFRISIIALAEGALAFFLFATTLALMLTIERMRADSPARGWLILTGLLAGSAMACKYPAALSVVIPAGIAIMLTAFRSTSADVRNLGAGAAPSNRATRTRRTVNAAVIYSVGVLITIGPWLVKNVVETGNPVYPLVYSVFGGHDWDEELNQKWKDGHSPDHHHPADLAVKLFDVTLQSDWLNPLLFGLAPLALFASQEGKRSRYLLAYVGFLFLSWWVFTHRIDRFWVPMIPVVSLLAGVGAGSRPEPLWNRGVVVIVAAVSVFNFVVCSMQDVTGYNARLADLETARERAANRSLKFLGSRLPPDARVLLVGEADVFTTTFPIVYNTVFDHCIFKEWCAEHEPGVSERDLKLRPADEILNRLAAEGITHIFVDWQEILRYRQTYRFTDFVTPARFRELEEQGVIAEFLPPILCGAEKMSERDLKYIESWSPELRDGNGDQDTVICGQFFRVVDDL